MEPTPGPDARGQRNEKLDNILNEIYGENVSDILFEKKRDWYNEMQNIINRSDIEDIKNSIKEYFSNKLYEECIDPLVKEIVKKEDTREYIKNKYHQDFTEQIVKLGELKGLLEGDKTSKENVKRIISKKLGDLYMKDSELSKLLSESFARGSGSPYVEKHLWLSKIKEGMGVKYLVKERLLPHDVVDMLEFYGVRVWGEDSRIQLAKSKDDLYRTLSSILTLNENSYGVLVKILRAPLEKAHYAFAEALEMANKKASEVYNALIDEAKDYTGIQEVVRKSDEVFLKEFYKEFIENLKLAFGELVKVNLKDIIQLAVGFAEYDSRQILPTQGTEVRYSNPQRETIQI